MNKDSTILILGHSGLVGSAMVRILEAEGHTRVAYPAPRVDLRDAAAIRAAFGKIQPNFVIMAAGKVGGIVANSSYPYDFLYDNLMMSANVIDCCREHQVSKLLMLGSNCIYPLTAPQPIREESLLAGPIEPTNEWYAVAKIAGIKLAQAARIQHGLDAIVAIPTNLYGPNDNFHPQHSHVLPALLRKFHDAKLSGAASVTLWGTGKPKRQFLHVDDLARALLLLLKDYSSAEIINVGCGEDASIAELAQIVREAVGFQGQIVYDPNKPDGNPRKQIDSSRILALGWTPRISLRQGIHDLYRWYLDKPPGSREPLGSG